jgi:hypothetical protein
MTSEHSRPGSEATRGINSVIMAVDALGWLGTALIIDYSVGFQLDQPLGINKA